MSSAVEGGKQTRVGTREPLDRAPRRQESSNEQMPRSRKGGYFPVLRVNDEFDFTFAAITSPANEQRPPKAPACGAVGPLAFAPRRQRATPIMQKGGQSDRPSLLRISGRASLKDAGNLVRLAGGFGVAAPCGFREPVKSPISHLTRRKVHGDDLGHVVVSKSLPVREVQSPCT